MHKRLLPILGIIAVLALFGTALAADMVLTAKVQSVTTGITKTGDQYVRIVVTEQKTLQGVSYEKGTPVMAFRDLTNEAKKYGEGDTLKAIVSPREFEGKSSYLVRKFLE